MVAIGVFYPVVINTAAGVRQIAPIFLDVGRNFGASRFNMFRTVALPGALPLIMTGIKLGAGMGLVLIAIAEMVGAKQGLGYMIWNAWELFDVQTMYVGLFVIAIIGFVMNAGFDALERAIVPWRKG
jgi:NitT/TauT family transport system permease protein